jgi:hypothetical protein
MSWPEEAAPQEYVWVVSAVLEVSAELVSVEALVSPLPPLPVSAGGRSYEGTPNVFTPAAPLVGGAAGPVATHWTTCPIGTSDVPHVHALAVDFASFELAEEHAAVVAMTPPRRTRTKPLEDFADLL